MYDPGTTNAHTNRYDYGDLTRLDSLVDVTWACRVHIKTAATWGTGRHIFGKDSSGGLGFYLRSAATRGIVTASTQGGGGTRNVSNAIAMADDITYSIVIRSHSVDQRLNIQIDGLDESETDDAVSADPGNSEEITICSHPDQTGAAVIVGQCMVWPNYYLTDAERSQYHAGLVVPAAANLSFWEPCIAEPGADLIFGDTGTENGTITLFSDAVGDSMFTGQGFLLPHRQLAGYNIRILSCSPELYKFHVPAEYAALSLGADIRIADGNLPAGTTLLGTLNEHFMLDDWRGLDAVILEANIEPNGELSMLVYSRMPSMSLFWQTQTLDTGHFVNSSEEGTASLVPWASMTNSRNSQHFIVDSSEESSRVKLGSVPRFSSKTNHFGTLYEDAAKNLVQNSAFLDNGAGPPTFLDMTEDLGTGATITAVSSTTIPMLFIDPTIQGKAVRAAAFTKGSAGNCLASWSLAIDTSGDAARILFWHRGAAGTYSLQRSDNSRYWDGDSWEVGITHLTLAAESDEWLREDTGVIDDTFPTTGTLTLSIGMDSATGAENSVIYFAQMMAYQHWAIMSDIVTQGGITVTSEVDDEVWDLDNSGGHSAQTFNPNRGTVRARLRFTTDTADIPNSTNALICRFGIDATNIDQFYLQRDSGGQYRIIGQRVIAGSIDASAILNLTDHTIGTEIEVAFRWTDAGGDELGLAARTLSVFVDGVKGTDDQASAIHSTSDQTTFIRWGAIAHTDNLKIAYIKNVELVQWVIPDEGIQARRVAN